jgi:uncharacterized membrane protein YsdA (DUF1294 family)
MGSIVIYLIGVNLFTVLLMRIDKQKAIKQQFRIPERTFWALSILGGALGTYIGMKWFRHKTKHASFVIGMPVLIIFHLVLTVFLSQS